MSEHDTSSRASLPFLEDGEYVFDRQLSPEQNLWAAVVHRARLDAQGYREGSEADWRNWPQQSACRWFRNRKRRDIGSWRWVADALGLPSWMVRRIVRESVLDVSFNRGSLSR